MPELAGQRISGTPLSERECFARAIGAVHRLRELAMQRPDHRLNVSGRFVGAIECTQEIRDCLRGIGLLRMDQRWILLARTTENIADNVRMAMRTPSRQDWRGLAPICERLEHTIRKAMDKPGRPPLLIPREWERN